MIGLFSPWRWMALAAAVAALIGAWQWDRYSHGAKRYQVGKTEVRQQWDAAVSQARADALIQAGINARETERRLKAQKEAQDAQTQALARARADAAGAADAAARLRDHIARLIAAPVGAAASHPAPASDGTPEPSTADLLADVLGRCVTRAGELAIEADTSRAAGQLCQRAYEAISHD